VKRASRSPDLAAVRADLTETWNKGQVEGQITRLKLINRAMFGRASFDVLRRRVLGRR
jgi:transposase